MKKNEVTCVALMDGSLHDLKFESIEKVLLQCLIEHDLSYSDLKVKFII